MKPVHEVMEDMQPGNNSRRLLAEAFGEQVWLSERAFLAIGALPTKIRWLKAAMARHNRKTLTHHQYGTILFDQAEKTRQLATYLLSMADDLDRLAAQCLSEKGGS